MQIDIKKRYQTKNCLEVKNLHIDSYKSHTFSVRGIVIDPYASDASKREVEHSWTLEGRWSQRETSFLDLVEFPERSMQIDIKKRYQTKNCLEVKNLHIDSYKSHTFSVRGIVIDPYASDASKREVEHCWTLEGRWSQRETSFLDLVEVPE